MPKKFSLVDGDALCYTLATKSVADFSGACRFSPHSLLNTLMVVLAIDAEKCSAGS